MYTDDDGEHIIQILEDGKPAGGIRLSDDMYNAIKDHFSPRLKDIRDDKEPIINQAWALKFMSEKEQ